MTSRVRQNFFSLCSQKWDYGHFPRSHKELKTLPRSVSISQEEWDNPKALESGSRPLGWIWEPAPALLTSWGNIKVLHLSKNLHCHYSPDLHKRSCCLTPFTFGNFLQTQIWITPTEPSTGAWFNSFGSDLSLSWDVTPQALSYGRQAAAGLC